MERLFRASEHGFSAKAFHQKCDNQEDTLVLVRTQFGKTISGYTHYPWTSHGGGEYVRDSGHRAFLFSLDMREKFVPQRDEKLIYRYSGWGPCFGVVMTCTFRMAATATATRLPTSPIPRTVLVGTSWPGTKTRGACSRAGTPLTSRWKSTRCLGCGTPDDRQRY